MKVTLFKHHLSGRNKEVVWLLSLPLENSMTHSKCSKSILDDERSIRTINLVFSGQAISLNHSCPQALVGITVIHSKTICAGTVQGVENGTVTRHGPVHRCLSV